MRHPKCRIAGGLSTESGSRRASVYDFIRRALGLLLIVAAALKGHWLSVGSAVEDGILGSRWLAIGLVELEAAFGLWLLIGLYPVTTRRVAIGCFSLLGGVALYKGLSGEASCGCLGGVRLTPAYAVALDLAALAGLLLFRAPPAAQQAGETASRLGLFVTLSLWVGIPSAMLAGQGMNADPAALSPNRWVGRCLPILNHIDVGDRLGSGRWIVLFYRRDCPACRSAVAHEERLARESQGREGAPRVALNEIPSHRPAAEEIVPANSSCLLGRLDQSRVWPIPTPTEISLRDCIVQPPSRVGRGR